MNVDNGPCNPWPAGYIWDDPRLIDHRGEFFCANGYHYQVRADEITGRPATWVLGWCPRSEIAHQIGQAESGQPTFSNFDPKYQEKAHAAVMSWVAGFTVAKSRNLYLFGSFGTGKTHLAMAALNDIKRRGLHCVFVRAEDLLDTFLASMPTNNYPDEHNAALRRIREIETADLVLIDDLGGQTTKQESDLFLQRFKSMLDDMRGVWIITTNSDGGRLEARLGEAIMSRLRKDVMKIEMIGDDYRRKQTKKGAA